MFVIKKRTEKKFEKITIENIVGIKFKSKHDGETVYEVKEIIENNVVIVWGYNSINKNTRYTIRDAILNFEKRDWIEIKK